MVTFIIFWAALFALVFFVLGVIFKALASAFHALLFSIGRALAVGGLAGLAALVLYSLYAIVNGIARGDLITVIEAIVVVVLVLCLFGAIVVYLGAILLEFVFKILEIVSGILEWFADRCEKGYINFLTVIVNRLNKC